MKIDAAISLLALSFSMGLYRGLYLFDHNENLYDILGQANEVILLTCICLVSYKRRWQLILAAFVYGVMSLHEFKQTINKENIEVTITDWGIIFICIVWYSVSVYFIKKSRL